MTNEFIGVTYGLWVTDWGSCIYRRTRYTIPAVRRPSEEAVLLKSLSPQQLLPLLGRGFITLVRLPGSLEENVSVERRERTRL